MRQLYKIVVELVYPGRSLRHVAVVECASNSVHELLTDVNTWVSNQSYEVAVHGQFNILRKARRGEFGVVSCTSDIGIGSLNGSLAFPDYGRSATVHPHAPKEFRPAETGSVFSMSRVTDDQRSANLKWPLGTMLVGLEFENGESTQVPAGWLLVHDD